MRISLLVATGLLLSSGGAWAQDCGGMVNVNGVCIPPDQGSSPLNDSYGNGGDHNETLLPQVKWADSWGAIADDGRGTVGAVTDLPSKRKARVAAIQECLNRGGGKCIVKTEYRNQCAVIVDGDTGSNIVNAETVGKATDIGMQSCYERNDTNCRVYYSGCSLAKRVW